jgi:hypothetical protein
MPITDDELRRLFVHHCACRPLNLYLRTEDHAPGHTCNTDILHDIQIALGLRQFDDIGRIQAMREARTRCAKVL